VDIYNLIKNNFLPGKKRVLEAGCGNGDFLKEVSSQYPDIVFYGVDPYINTYNEGNLYLIREYAENIAKLPGWFDLIFSIHSLHHFSSAEEFFKSCEGKLKLNGELIIYDWKQGAKTGIPEKYYSLGEIKKFIEKTFLKIVSAYTEGENNILIATKKVAFVAVATDDGETVFEKMFGRATFFKIYEYRNGKLSYRKTIRNKYRDTFQHLKTYDVYSQVDFCEFIITGNIGKKGEQRLKSLGTEIIKAKGNIENVIYSSFKEKI